MYVIAVGQGLFDWIAVVQNEIGPRCGFVDGKMMPFQTLGPIGNRVNGGWSTKCGVALYQRIGVLIRRHYFILIGDYVQNGNFKSRQPFQVVDRVVLKREGFGFTQLEHLLKLRPTFGVSGTLAFATRPTFDVTYGSFSVNAGHLVGVSFRPGVDVQPTSAHPFQGYFGGKIVLVDQMCIHLIPSLHGGGATVLVVDVYKYHMKTFGQQQTVHLGMPVRKRRPPYPGFAFQGLFWFYIVSTMFI